MGRSKDIKSKDTKNGDRAELLCAIAWLHKSSQDKIIKSSNEIDIIQHIDWFVFRDSKMITNYDVKARRFENYGRAFHEDQYFIAELESRHNNGEGNTGSIYGKQKYMALEIAGGFVYISTKEIREYVETWVKPFSIYKTIDMNAAFESIVLSKYDDGSEITGLAFSRFPDRKTLLLPKKFLSKQFIYSVDELREYVVNNKLNIQL